MNAPIAVGVLYHSVLVPLPAAADDDDGLISGGGLRLSDADGAGVDDADAPALGDTDGAAVTDREFDLVMLSVLGGVLVTEVDLVVDLVFVGDTTAGTIRS